MSNMYIHYVYYLHLCYLLLLLCLFVHKSTCVPSICPCASLCMCTVYLYCVSILCIYTFFIYHIGILLCIDTLYRSIFLSIVLCPPFMYTIYLYCLCILYMYAAYVYYVCIRCRCILYISLFSRLSIHPSICLSFCQSMCTI